MRSISTHRSRARGAGAGWLTSPPAWQWGCAATLCGLLLVGAPSAATGTLELDSLHSWPVGGAASSSQQLDWRPGAWRWRGERRVGARQSPSWRGTLTGPASGPLRSWVLGRFSLQAGLGSGGLSSARSGHRLPRLSPAPGGWLLGAGFDCRYRTYSLLLAAGRRLDTTASRVDEAPSTMVAIGMGAERRALTWSVLALVPSVGRPPILNLGLGAHRPAGDWQLDLAGGPGSGRELALAARGLAALGEASMRLRLRPMGAPDIRRSPAAATADHRLELGWRSYLRGIRLDMSAASRVPDRRYSTFRTRAARRLAGGIGHLILTGSWAADGPLASAVLTAPRGRLAWVRAAADGTAWLARARWLAPPGWLVRGVELEVRGWRGAAGRRAAGALGGGLGEGSRRLGATAAGGSIAACRLDLQRQPVRVKLALATREGPGGARDDLASCRVQWCLN